MEIASWKIVLLEWANLSGYLDRVYFNLNQSDIEHFFLKFKSTFTTVKITVNDCSQFLKAYYPEFETHTGDDGQLSSEDYIYIYSLFLHFSCVLHPVVECQEICKNMKETSQFVIAKFLQTLVEHKKFTKDALRWAISNAVPSDFGGVGGGGGSGQSFINVSTPLKLNVSSENYSPPTPKSKMLEEWNIEMKNLKAQLETERYEKGFLEVQMKQYEEKNKKLTNEHRQLLNDIHDLKNSLLIRDTENISPNRNITEELVKRRLLKEISEKDETIMKLKLNISDLKEDKSSLAEEIEYARKQYVTVTATANELEFQLNQMKSNLEEKDVVIQNLQTLNNELETFISESRGTNKLSILDSSMDSFNYSASAMNMGGYGGGSPNVNGGDSSRSYSFSPENLGRSVVDIQLKEEKLKNKELCESIDRLKDDNKRISENLNEFIKKNSIVFKVWDISDLLSDTGDISENFMIYINYFEKLVEKYTTLETDLKSKGEEFNRLVADVKTTMNIHENDLKNLVHNKSELELTNNKLKEELLEKDTINKNLQSNNSQFQEKLQNSEIQCANLNASLKKSQEYGEHAANEIQSLNIQLVKLNDIQKTNEFDLNDLRQNIVKLNESIVELESVKNQLSQENTKQNENLIEKHQQINNLNLQLVEINKILGEKSLILNETLERNNMITIENDEQREEIKKLIDLTNVLEDDLLDAQQQLTNLQTESARLQSEINVNENTITELTAKVKHLKECNSKMYQESIEFSKSMDILIDNNNKFAIENQKLTEELEMLKKSFTKLNQNYNKKLDTCIELNDQLTVNNNEIQDLKKMLKSKINELHTLNIEQNEITKKRLDLENNIQNLNDIHFELKNNLEELENTKIALNNENVHLNETIKSMQIQANDLNNLKLIYDKSTDEFVNEKRNLNAALELLTEEKLTIETKKTELEYENQQLTITTSDLRRQLQEINIIRNEMEIEKIRISTEYEEVLIKNDFLNEEISIKTLECANLKSQSDDLRVTNERITIEKNEISTELNRVQKENTSLNNAIVDIQNEMDILQKEKLQITNDLETIKINAKLENNNFQLQLTNTQNEFEQKSKTNTQEYKFKLSELQNSLELKLIEYEQLSVSHKELENKYKNNEIDIKNLHIIIAELRVQLDNLYEEKLNFIKRLEETSCEQNKYENTMKKFVEIKMFLSTISQQITNELSESGNTLDTYENTTNNNHNNTNECNTETGGDLPLIVEIESISKNIEKKLKEKQNQFIQMNEQKHEYTKLYKESINQTDNQRNELEISQKKIVDLEFKISELNTILNDHESLKSSNETLMLQIEELNKNIHFDKDKLKFANSKISELEIRINEMDSISQTNEKLTLEVTEFKEKIQFVQIENKTAMDNIEKKHSNKIDLIVKEREIALLENCKLQVIIDELQQKINLLKIDNEKILTVTNEKLCKLENEFKTKNEDLHREYKIQIDEYKQEIIEKDQQITDLDRKFSDNDNVLKSSIEENLQLKEKILDLENKIKELNDSYEDSSSITSKKLSDMEMIVKNAEEIKLKYENLLLDNENTQEEISELKSSLAKTEMIDEENLQLKENITNLENKIKEINDSYENSSTITNKKLSDLESIAKDTEEIKLKYENLLLDTENTQEEISELKSSLAENGMIVEENLQLKENITELENRIKQLNDSYENSSTITSKKLSDLESIAKDTEEIKLKYENLLLDNENTQQEISELKSSLAETEMIDKENLQLKENNTELENKIKDLIDSYENSSTITSKKLSDLESIAKDTEEIKLKYENLLLDNENTQHELSKVKSSCDKKLSDMELIVKNTDEIKLKYENLILENENTQHEISELKSSLAENGIIVEENLQLKENITNLENKIKEINDSYENSSTITSKKLSDLESIAKDTEEIKLKYENLQLDNENIQLENSELKSSLAENGIIVEENLQLKENITNLENKIKEINDSYENSSSITSKKLSDMEMIVKNAEEIKLKYENLLLDNENTQEEISELKSSLAKTEMIDKENLQLKENITELENKIKELNNSYENSLTISTKKLSDMELIVKNTEEIKLKYENVLLDNENIQLENSELKSSLAENGIIAEENLQLKENITNLENKIKEIIDSYEDSSTITNKKLSDLESIAKDTEEIKLKYENLLLDNENTQHELSKVKSSLTENGIIAEENLQLKENITELENKIKQLNDSYENSSTVTSKKLSDLESIAKDTEEIKLKYENLLLDNENTQEEISELKSSLAKTEMIDKENLQLKENITELENKIKQLTDSYENSSTITSKKLSDLESIVKDTETIKLENEKLQIDMETFNKQILNDKLITENQLKLSENKFSDLNNQLMESQRLNEKLKIQFDDTTKCVLQLNENILQLKVDNENLLIESVKLGDQYKNNEHTKQKEIVQITNENTKLSRELKVANENYQSIDEKLSKQELKIKILEDEKSTLENQIKNVLHSREIEMEEFKRGKEEAILQKQDDNKQSLNDHTVMKQQNEKLKQDVAILQAKLYKHRDMTKMKEDEWKREMETTVKEQKSLTEKSIKENRLELEGKLDKMKAKMKDLYNEEITRAKQKHEQETFEYKTQVHQQKHRLEQYDIHVKKLSKQIFQLNERQLEIQKQNEFFKSKANQFENHPSSVLAGGNNKPQLMLPNHLKMEDEEGEVFNNTYLHDLKNGGKLSPTGRQSVRFSELQFRNSLCLPHLRSAYAAQYQDQDFREEDIKSPRVTKTFADLLGNCILPQSEHKHNKQITYRKMEDIGRRSIGDDSLLSGQSEVRRGTIYKRPGPPTPSKNGGRLSFGGAGEIMPREIFKEIHSNQYNVQTAPAPTPATATTFLNKKTTPGKLRAMFTSSKVKDENSTPTRRRLSIFKSRSNK